MRVTKAAALLDFRDWHALHALTQTLFKDGFGIEGWHVPQGCLVPTLPNRLNYMLWVQDLLALSRPGMCASALATLPVVRLSASTTTNTFVPK